LSNAPDRTPRRNDGSTGDCNSDYFIDIIQTIFSLESYMKEVQIADGIVPLGEFKAQASKLLKRIGESGQPIVITQNGRPAGVLLSPREYDRMQERQRFLESIAAGLADAENGRTLTTVELRERLRAWRSDRDDG
jgi:prevent-host-death family protein